MTEKTLGVLQRVAAATTRRVPKASVTLVEKPAADVAVLKVTFPLADVDAVLAALSGREND